MSDVMATDQAQALRSKFLGWQCRVRQYCVRQYGGRPLPGMRPDVVIAGLDKSATINTVMVKQDSKNITAQFKHIVRKTVDANDRYDTAIQLLSAAYYQHPTEFSDSLTASFGLDSAWADRIRDAGRCELRFEQANQAYNLVCDTRELHDSDDEFQATYWHNHLFNPSLPGAVRIICFTPDWALSEDQSEV